MIIESELNIDLKQGQQLWSCSLGSLNLVELAKVYAYVLFHWGEGPRSRLVLDELNNRENGTKQSTQEECLFAI